MHSEERKVGSNLSPTTVTGTEINGINQEHIQHYILTLVIIIHLIVPVLLPFVCRTLLSDVSLC